MVALWIIGADLHWKFIRIQDVETEAAALLIDRRNAAGLEIRGYRVFVEVVDSDRQMVHFRGGFAGPQDEKVFSEHELIVSFPFVHCATEHALVEIRRSLQIADLQ